MLGWATGPPCATGLEASLLGIDFSFWEELYGQWKQPLPSREAMSPALSRSSNFILFSWTTDVKIFHVKRPQPSWFKPISDRTHLFFLFSIFRFSFRWARWISEEQASLFAYGGRQREPCCLLTPLKARIKVSKAGRPWSHCVSPHDTVMQYLEGLQQWEGDTCQIRTPPLFKCSFGRQF